jgi:hypothetical protein
LDPSSVQVGFQTWATAKHLDQKMKRFVIDHPRFFGLTEFMTARFEEDLHHATHSSHATHTAHSPHAACRGIFFNFDNDSLCGG